MSTIQAILKIGYLLLLGRMWSAGGGWFDEIVTSLITAPLTADYNLKEKQEIFESEG